MRIGVGLGMTAPRGRAPAAPPPAIISETDYSLGQAGTGAGSFTPFTGLDLSSADLALFIAVAQGTSAPSVISVGAGSTSGWTALDSTRGLLGNISAAGGFARVFRRTSPSASETLELSGSATPQPSWRGVLLLFSDANAVAIAGVNRASGTNPNPPAIDMGAPHDALVLPALLTSAAGMPSLAPTDYTNLRSYSCQPPTGQNTGEGRIVLCERSLTAQTEDPGAYTAASAYRCMFTVGVYKE